MKLEINDNTLQRGKEIFYRIMEQQNILWDLIDAKLVEEDTEIKPRKKVKPKFELETI